MRKVLIPFLGLLFLCIYSCQKDPIAKFDPKVTTDGHITDSLQSSEDSIHLSGSATDKDGQVVGYLWSLVSGPTVANIITPGQPETDVNMVVSGTYIFQLMATDNDGLTGVAFDTVTVVLKQPTTVSLQNPSSTTDEMFIAGNVTDNYSDGGSIELVAQNWTQYGLFDYAKGIIKFDLSNIPAGKTVKSASLTLYSNPTPHNGNLVDANYGSENALFIERITSSWNNLTTTWQNQPSTDQVDHVSIPQSNQTKEDLIDVDVTSLVQKMISGTNYGFEIKLQGTNLYNCRIFCSSRYPDASKHPVLKVTY